MQKLFDCLLEIDICDEIINNKFKICNKKFNKEDILNYKDELTKEVGNILSK